MQTSPKQQQQSTTAAYHPTTPPIFETPVKRITSIYVAVSPILDIEPEGLVTPTTIRQNIPQIIEQLNQLSIEQPETSTESTEQKSFFAEEKIKQSPQRNVVILDENDNVALLEKQLTSVGQRKPKLSALEDPVGSSGDVDVVAEKRQVPEGRSEVAVERLEWTLPDVRAMLYIPDRAEDAVEPNIKKYSVTVPSKRHTVMKFRPANSVCPGHCDPSFFTPGFCTPCQPIK